MRRCRGRPSRRGPSVRQCPWSSQYGARPGGIRDDATTNKRPSISSGRSSPKRHRERLEKTKATQDARCSAVAPRACHRISSKTALLSTKKDAALRVAELIQLVTTRAAMISLQRTGERRSLVGRGIPSTLVLVEVQPCLEYDFARRIESAEQADIVKALACGHPGSG